MVSRPMKWSSAWDNAVAGQRLSLSGKNSRLKSSLLVSCSVAWACNVEGSEQAMLLTCCLPWATSRLRNCHKCLPWKLNRAFASRRLLFSGKLLHTMLLPSLNQNVASGMLSEAFSISFLPRSSIFQTGALWQLCTGILINPITFFDLMLN